MSYRLRLIVAYDGASFAGWQSQAHRNTVQDHLERTFKRISGESVRVHGAGRTDAGVHALGQCAHVDIENEKLTPARWLIALNALLPPTVRVMRCGRVGKNFHARFSARGKIYQYRIWLGQVLPPLEHGRAWHVSGRFDLETFKSAANRFAGRHDFAGYAANRGKRETDTVRTIHSIKVRHSGSWLTVDFDGDGFLYKMVRLIIGSLVQCATGKMAAGELLQNGARRVPARLVAPAEGLFLVKVLY